jgi:hypothetical protein
MSEVVEEVVDRKLKVPNIASCRFETEFTLFTLPGYDR